MRLRRSAARRIGLAASLWLLLAPSATWAQGDAAARELRKQFSPTSLVPLVAPPQPSNLSLSLDLDLNVMVTGLMLGLAPKLADVGSHAIPFDSLRLDPRRINPLDRTVVGNRSQQANRTSDILLGLGVTAPFVISLGEAIGGAPGSRRWKRLATDMTVLAKTLAVNAAICNLVKFTVRRPRPYLYDLQAHQNEDPGTEGHLSFFSGHTSWSFAMATGYSYLFTMRHPDSPWVVPVWLGTHAVAGTTAVMRVLAGKHFWTDILVGAAVGSAIGFLVPHMHRDDGGLRNTLLAKLRLTPAFYDGGFGVNAVLWW